MIKKLKVTIFSKFIFILIALCFLFGIYLSIPVLFNYKSIENIIESKFYSDFNINLNINGDIKYQLLPKPHLLISNSLLSINKNNNNHMTVDINNLKVFLNSNSLYPKSKIDFQKIEIQKTNFLLNKKEYIILRNYLHNSETKPIHIKKSKVFVVDKNDEAFIISPNDSLPLAVKSILCDRIRPYFTALSRNCTILVETPLLYNVCCFLVGSIKSVCFSCASTSVAASSVWNLPFYDMRL